MAHTFAPLLSGNTIGSFGDDFIIAEWSDSGHAPGPPFLIAPPHVHHQDDEAWYVLEGVLCVRVGEEIIEARAGSCVFVKRGTPHTYWNPTIQPTRYLLIMTPKIARLIDEIHAMTDRNFTAIAALFKKYDSTLLE